MYMIWQPKQKVLVILHDQRFDTNRNTPEEVSIKSKGVGCNSNNDIYNRTSDHQGIIDLHSFVGIIKVHLSGLRINNHLHLIGVMDKLQSIKHLNNHINGYTDSRNSNCGSIKSTLLIIPVTH